mmetsp:Transcript_62841/g.158659  ORF Transcript_62841/g.158659 Transcript_62841/m.158659 type:complete len:245 (-) Transcript_62841:679-1413(-)
MRSRATENNSVALSLTFLSVASRVKKRRLRCCTRCMCGAMAVSLNLVSCCRRRACPSCKTWPVLDCMTWPRSSRSSARLCSILLVMRWTSLSEDASPLSAARACSTSPSKPVSPFKILRMSSSVFCTNANSTLSSPASPARWLLASAASDVGFARTHMSPSLHSKEPSSHNLPRNVSSVRMVETWSALQISNSESSPQCQVMIESSMVHRGCLSTLPIQTPSKPLALQMYLFNLEAPALNTSFI